ncbi:MAG: hypothetical protein ACYDFT_06770 [Thermoplasmata archaeon]
MQRTTLLMVLVLALVVSSGISAVGSSAVARAVPVRIMPLPSHGAGPIVAGPIRSNAAPAPLSGWNWSNLTAWQAGRGAALNGSLETAAWDPSLGGILALVEAKATSTVATWLFQNGSWSALNVTGTPPITQGEMTYDGYDGYIVFYGGVNSTGSLSNQTWIFYRDSWIQIEPTVNPTAEVGFSLTYDPAAQEVVLVGGYDGSLSFNATWLYHDGQWSQGPPLPGPGLFAPLMAYEAATGADILFGGSLNSGGTNNQTYAYRIGGWSVVNTVNGPAAPSRWIGAMASDPANGAVVLVEDATSAYNGALATWSYFMGRWSNLSATGPVPMESYGALVGDPALNSTAYVGGEVVIANLKFAIRGPVPITWVLHGPLHLSLVASPSGPLRNLGNATVFHALVSGGIGTAPTFDWSAPTVGCGTSSGPLLTCSDTVTGPYSVSVSVRDPGDLPVVASLNYTVILPTLGAPSASRPSADVGQSVTFTLPLPAGAAPTSIVWLGLPPGCFQPTAASVACAPIASGTFSIRGSVSYPNGTSVVGSALTYAVSNDPALGRPILRTAGTVNSTIDVGGSANLSAALAAPGSGGPYRYNWTGLPAGCPEVNASVVPCRPTSSGLYQVAVEVTDSNGQTVLSPAAILEVNPPLLVTPALLSGALSVGAPTNWTASISGGTGPFALSWFVGGTEVGQGPFLSYRFTATGPATVTVRANDSTGALQSASIIVEVGPTLPGGSGSGSSSNGATPAEQAIWVAALILALLAIGGVAYLLWRRSPPTAAVHPPGPVAPPAAPAGTASKQPSSDDHP